MQTDPWENTADNRLDIQFDSVRQGYGVAYGFDGES